jgi:hypothetical protein
MNNMWTAKNEWFPQANRFTEESIAEYTSGRVPPDTTTISKAAEGGFVDFLKWCAGSGYASQFTWLITSGLILDYAVSRPWLVEWRKDAERLGVDMAVFEQFIV